MTVIKEPERGTPDLLINCENGRVPTNIHKFILKET